MFNLSRYANARSLMILAIIALLAGQLLTGCNSSRKNAKGMDGENWYQKQEWLGGLQLTPHSSINKEEFFRQYHSNNKWWDEAFTFLRTHDLNALAPGSYIIDSTNVFATVSQLTPGEKEKIKFEAHRAYNDLQYIISGKAVMGVSPIDNPEAKITVPYSKDKDGENFVIEKGANYYTAEPGTFFIFSPKEIHRPAFKLAGYEQVKKIVIKVRVPV